MPYAAIAAAMAASGGVTCTITAGNTDVNIRSSASTSSTASGVLRKGTSAEANGSTVGGDGKNWYRLVTGGYVRSDVVSGDCSALPQM